MRPRGDARSTEALASGEDVAYDTDPGFVDLPGFRPILVGEIGLYVDEYRRKLSSDREIDRFGEHAANAGAGYDIRDRD